MLYGEGQRSVELMEQFEKMRKWIHCRLVSASFSQLEECDGGYSFALTIDFSFVFLVKYFVPKWEYLVVS